MSSRLSQTITFAVVYALSLVKDMSLPLQMADCISTKPLSLCNASITVLPFSIFIGLIVNVLPFHIFFKQSA